MEHIVIIKTTDTHKQIVDPDYGKKWINVKKYTGNFTPTFRVARTNNFDRLNELLEAGNNDQVMSMILTTWKHSDVFYDKESAELAAESSNHLHEKDKVKYVDLSSYVVTRKDKEDN